jgi:hypothetical protein
VQEVWERLKPELRRLFDHADSPLQGYPNPDIDTNRTPPFAIDLRPWAIEVAADLHHRFGPDVELTVGAMTYPAGTLITGADSRRARWPEVPTAAETEISVTVPAPLTVASGYEVETDLTVHNRSAHPMKLWTSGTLIGNVVDPATGDCIGGVIRQWMKLVIFGIAAGESTTIPFRATTDSLVTALGYAVPPGLWATQTLLVLDDDRRQVKTPPLPLTVTAPR